MMRVIAIAAALLLLVATACGRRDLADALYPDGTPAHYTTVQKLLERLEAKGYVASRRDGPRREAVSTSTSLIEPT